MILVIFTWLTDLGLALGLAAFTWLTDESSVMKLFWTVAMVIYFWQSISL